MYNIVNFYLLSNSDLPERLEWPAMTICMMPRYKSKGVYMQFLYKGFYELFQSNEEFEAMEAMAFYKDAKQIGECLKTIYFF